MVHLSCDRRRGSSHFPKQTPRANESDRTKKDRRGSCHRSHRPRQSRNLRSTVDGAGEGRKSLNTLVALNPRVRHVAIDRDGTEARQVMAVPAVLLNGEPFGEGRMMLEQILAKFDTAADAREAEKIKALGSRRRAGGGRRQSTRRARVSAPVSRPSASVARFWTSWESGTSSRSPTLGRTKIKS